ncbi:hypothetical protein H5410_022865 [Solanum commersonii]|uniref:Uncharacterized protein n=1 Tax=Solanum commersonii TaxID=4109 RepID=A0A9J5ZIA7_SOLCO|nr:hypothetical protein H5410_022865 [Solanum commersonii]
MTIGDSVLIGSASATQSVETLEEIEKKRNHPLYLHPSDTPGCTQSRRESLEPIALYAGRGNFQRNNDARRGNIQRNNMRSPQLKKKNWDKICDYCNVQGHVKLDCYKLNGYPPDWKFKKKQPENFASGYDQNFTGQM